MIVGICLAPQWSAASLRESNDKDGTGWRRLRGPCLVVARERGSEIGSVQVMVGPNGYGLFLRKLLGGALLT